MKITDQQKLVLNRVNENLVRITESTDKLYTKSNVVLGSSAALMSFLLTTGNFNSAGLYQAVFIMLSLAAGGLVCWTTIRLFSPREISTPGTTDFNDLETNYLERDTTDAVRQVLADLTLSINRHLEVNRHVSKSLRNASHYFLAQVLCVAFAVLCRLLGL